MVVRIARVTVGIVLLLVGAILSLPFVPGPGIICIIVGLEFVSHEFEWAKRLRTWLHREFHRLTRREHVG